jgi:hypothetical protein
MLCYKDLNDSAEIKNCTPRMKAIVFVFNGYCEMYLQKCPVITSVFRNETGSLHILGRAVDIKAKDWADNDIAKIRDFINYIFPHKTKQTCYVHQTDKNNRDTLHFHLQDLT